MARSSESKASVAIGGYSEKLNRLLRCYQGAERQVDGTEYIVEERSKTFEEGERLFAGLRGRQRSFISSSP